MHINFLNQSHETSWRNYSKYLKPLLLRTKEVLSLEYDLSVSVVLVDDDTIHQYNRDYRNIDRPTDVLSFPDGEFEDGVLLMGDIIISTDAIRRQSLDYNHSLKREFCFLVAHGYLHLLGYDHHTDKEEQEMIGLQKEILHEIAKR